MPSPPLTSPAFKFASAKSTGGGNCLRINLRLQKIGPKMNLLTFDKMKTATMWLSDDHERVPVELRNEIFIGDVRAILVGKEYFK
jgi:hypothetical protein